MALACGGIESARWSGRPIITIVLLYLPVIASVAWMRRLGFTVTLLLAATTTMLLAAAMVMVVGPSSPAVAAGEVAPRDRICFSVAGDPGDVAVVNVTPVEAGTAGYGSLVSSDLSSVPEWSNVNFGLGTVDPNVAMARIGADGEVCFVNSVHTMVHVVADHLGTIDGDVFSSARANGAPNRRIDTRSGSMVAPSARRCFSVAGDPGDVAVVNVTPVEAGTAGYGSLVSSDLSSVPEWSNVNFGLGTVDPNVAMARIGADGEVCFVNSVHTMVHVVADHLGTIDGDVFSSARANGAPNRRIDTRSGSMVAPSARRCFSVAGDPGDVAVVNVTPVEAGTAGYGSLVSSDLSSVPEWSNVNFGLGTVDPNVAMARIGADGEVCFVNSVHTMVHVVADHLGTIDGDVFSSATSSGAPDRSLDTRPPPPDFLSVYRPRPNCAEGNVVPLGQSPQAVNFEPLGAIWCFDLADPPARTAVEGANSWVDDFTVGCPVPAPAGCTSMMSLDNREMGYRAFDRTGSSPPDQGEHWINQNHWMTDVQGGFTGGSSLSPNRSFQFEDGRIVVEGDFAAGIPEYGDQTWGEITISTAAEPTGAIADPLYAYGQFGGEWAAGCRLTSGRRPVCAVVAPDQAYMATVPPIPGDAANCHRNDDRGEHRLLEISWFQQCGSTNYGGAEFGPNGRFWRACEPGGPDMACRDRFRLEVRKDGLKLYVNGALYFEDSGWPAAYQIPDSAIAGDWHAYQSNWQHRAGSRAFRYHWDHFAVNPPSGPTPSETFR